MVLGEGSPMLEQLRERQEAARRRFADAESALKPTPEETLEREVLELERKAADAEALVAIKGKYGPRGQRWDFIETTMGIVAARCPSDTEYKEWADNPNRSQEDVLEAFFTPCVLHPPVARLAEILRGQPATNNRIANLVSKLAGFRASDIAGK